MKKFDIRKIRIRNVSVDELNDRMLLLNLYITQAITLFIGLAWCFFQRRNPFALFKVPDSLQFLYWGFGFSLVVLAVDLMISRWVPEEAADDGGVNERIFRNRPLWHIALLSLVVAICEDCCSGVRSSMESGLTGPVFCLRPSMFAT